MSAEPTPKHLLSPTHALGYLHHHYGIIISIKSFYSMKSRGQAPKVTYFRGLPKFTVADIDEWVQNNLSDARNNGGVR